MKVVAIIVAAGKGERMGKLLPKQYLYLNDRPVMIHTLEVFEQASMVNEIILVVAPDKVGYCSFELLPAYRLNKVKSIIEGGKTRQESVFYGLNAVPDDTDIVIIHDGVRPLLSVGLIEKVIEAARRSGAAIPVILPKDTVKLIDEEGFIDTTISRDKIRLSQTPQAFKFDLIRRAYEEVYKKGIEVTDDSAILESYGHKIEAVEGEYTNIKITTPDDIIWATHYLSKRL